MRTLAKNRVSFDEARQAIDQMRNIDRTIARLQANDRKYVADRNLNLNKEASRKANEKHLETQKKIKEWEKKRQQYVKTANKWRNSQRAIGNDTNDEYVPF